MMQPAPQLAVLLRNMFCLRNDTISFTATAAVHEDSFHTTGAKFARRGGTSSSGTTFPRLLHSQPGSASSAFSAAEPLTPAGAAKDAQVVLLKKPTAAVALHFQQCALLLNVYCALKPVPDFRPLRPGALRNCSGLRAARKYAMQTRFARVAELVDALDLESSSSKEWEFKPPLSHQHPSPERSRTWNIALKSFRRSKKRS